MNLNKYIKINVQVLIFHIITSIIIFPVMAKDYQPNWESIDSRPTPEWFKDAKFGIFIHWGLYSVPAWGPKGSYAEWYLHGLKIGDSTRVAYHNKNYGEDFNYRDFAKEFKAENYNPEEWATLFKNAGAKYVVLTSKHHDGFCLWPSRESNGYNSVETASKKDLLGDLTTSVENAGLKMGFYYSLYEWEHPDYPGNVPKYVNEHMLPQFKDAVQRYKPSIIFADGEWDLHSRDWRSEEFLTWLFNESNAPEDVVVNDRWGGETRFTHGGYYSTEYDPNTGAMSDSFLKRGWEECRGIGKSFGYNRNEGPEDYMNSTDLIRMLVDIVSRGGNLLLNVGPKADGTIPQIMQDRLLKIGQWLSVNGEAIYETRPNRTMASEDGKIHYTLSQDKQILYAFVNNLPEEVLVIPEISSFGKGSIQLLGNSTEFQKEIINGDAHIQLPKSITKDIDSQPVYVFKIPVLPYLEKPQFTFSENPTFNDEMTIYLNTNNTDSEIYYSIDRNVDLQKQGKRYTQPFKLNNSGMLNCQAFAHGFQPSEVVTVPINILTEKNGIALTHYEGPWNNLDEMLTTQPTGKETVYDFTLHTDKDNDFGHQFLGKIQTEVDGNYEFRTTSDDGSRLLINNEVVVDNDGLHSRQIIEGEVYLTKGQHQIEVQFFERGGQEILEVQWKGPEFDWMEIPAYLLLKQKK